MKVIREHIVVKVESIFIDETEYIGYGGKRILMNVFYQPEYHIRTWGIVVSTPDELFAYPLMSNSLGQPAYHDEPQNEFKTNRDIPLEIQVGDKVYFHYNCLLPDQMDGVQFNHQHLGSSKDENGKLWHYFKVKYELVFAAVRYEKMNAAVKEFSWDDESKLKEIKITTEEKSTARIYGFTEKNIDHIYRKKVVMVGSYVLVKPDMESWKDISIKTYQTANGKFLLDHKGDRILKPESEWLVTKASPTEKYLRGWVSYCGSPLYGDKEFVRQGMYIYFQRFADTKLRFEGFDYFRMRQRHIMCIDPAKSLCLN